MFTNNKAIFYTNMDDTLIINILVYTHNGVSPVTPSIGSKPILEIHLIPSLSFSRLVAIHLKALLTVYTNYGD